MEEKRKNENEKMALRKKKFRSIPRKKKRFHANQFTSATTVHSDQAKASVVQDVSGILLPTTSRRSSEEKHISVSHRKLFRHDVSLNNTSSISKSNEPRRENVEGFRLMDMSILSKIICSLACPARKEICLTLHENSYCRKGSASYLILDCECGYSEGFYSSNRLPGHGGGFEVNKRLVYAMRSCGQGHAGLTTFSTLMNMPKPIAKNNYSKLAQNVGNACRVMAEESMQEASEELIKADNVTDVSVSCDGSWQKRGFTSMNGFVSAISIDTGKIVDVEPMSRYCRKCAINEKQKQSDPVAYESFLAAHSNCACNYKRSFPNMEVTGAKAMFERSIDKNKLRYTELFSDGDSKTLPAIVDIYLSKDIEPKI